MISDPSLCAEMFPAKGFCVVQYMDRIYVKHQNKAPVAQLGLDMWRDHVVRQRGIRDRMLTMLLELIQKERAGDIVDRALLRSITMVGLPIETAAQPRRAHSRAWRLRTIQLVPLATQMTCITFDGY